MSTVTEHVPAPPRRGGVLDVVRRRPLLAFVVLAIAASWLAWIPMILGPYGLGLVDITVPGGLDGWQLFGMLPGAFLGPIGSALFVTAVTEGRAGVRSWAKRLWRWKVNWRWYVGILVGTPTALVLSALVLAGDGGVHAPGVKALVMFLPVFIMQMMTTGLAEEPGWRDFALPRAQRLFGAPRAAAAIGLLWGVWHLPLFLTMWGGWPELSWVRPVEFIIFCIMFNVVMTWVFNRTGQSLPMAMLLHVSINTFASVALADMFPAMDDGTFQHALVLGSTVAAIVTLVATKGRLGYQPGPADEHTTRPVQTPRPLEVTPVA